AADVVGGWGDYSFFSFSRGSPKVMLGRVGVCKGGISLRPPIRGDTTFSTPLPLPLPSAVAPAGPALSPDHTNTISSRASPTHQPDLRPLSFAPSDIVGPPRTLCNYRPSEPMRLWWSRGSLLVVTSGVWPSPSCAGLTAAFRTRPDGYA